MAHTSHTHHVTPQRTLLMVFGSLVTLTALTVGAAMIDLGALNVPLALAIAVLKAALVVLFFMGLKYDRPVNVLVATIGGVWVIIFLTFTLFDTVFRGDFGNVDPQTIADQERAAKAKGQQELKVVTPHIEGGVQSEATSPAQPSTALAAQDSAASARQ